MSKSKRAGNYVAKRLYFDWQQLEAYKGLAAYLGLDVVTLMGNIISQGMAEVERQVLEVIKQEATKQKESIPEKTPEQVEATKAMFNKGESDDPDATQEEADDSVGVSD